MLISHKQYRTISDTEEHVYRFWEIGGPGYNPAHAKVVLDHELELHLAQLTPDEKKLEVIKELEANPNARLQNLNVTENNAEVTCNYCLGWIHA